MFNAQLIAMLLAGAISFAVAALAGPAIIRALQKLKFGQKILEDGPTWHMNKQNTPTMGGLIFILSIIAAIAAMLLLGKSEDLRPLYMLLLGLVFGAIGFIDDYTKVKKKRNKGLTAMQKLLGKSRFEELLAPYIEKPQGRPTLVRSSDKRPEWNTAKNDFMEEM